MPRHPFDVVSAALGILTVAAGLFVTLGEAGDLDARGSWWFAAAGVLVGLAIIPWRRRAGSTADVPAAEG